MGELVEDKVKLVTLYTWNKRKVLRRLDSEMMIGLPKIRAGCCQL